MRQCLSPYTVLFSFSVWLSPWQAVVLPLYMCAQIHKQNCMNDWLFPALSPMKWKKTLLQNILKRWHERTQVCPGDVPLCGWDGLLSPPEMGVTVHRRESCQDVRRHLRCQQQKPLYIKQYLKLLSGNFYCRRILYLLAIQKNTQVSLEVFQEHQSALKAEIQPSTSITGIWTQHLHRSSFLLSQHETALGRIKKEE